MLYYTAKIIEKFLVNHCENRYKYQRLSFGGSVITAD